MVSAFRLPGLHVACLASVAKGRRWSSGHDAGSVSRATGSATGVAVPVISRLWVGRGGLQECMEPLPCHAQGRSRPWER